MASLAASPSLYASINRNISHLRIHNPSSSWTLRKNGYAINLSIQHLTTKKKITHGFITSTRTRAVEEETLIPETQEEEETSVSEQPVSVPVSPSDMLTMLFQAEGTMNESDIPKVITALEQIEGVSDLQVRVVESIASVELTKQTTVQSTGVASSLVEVIQGSGFKLQTLNLSFKDEEDNID